MRWIARARATLFVAGSWAVVWGLISMALFSAVMLRLAPYQRTRIEGFLLVPGSVTATALLVGALLGFVAGLLFSFLLGSLEAQNESGRLSARRFAVWGGLAGLAMAAVVAGVIGWSVSLPLAGILGLCGATTAAGTVYLVGRAPTTADLPQPSPRLPA